MNRFLIVLALLASCAGPGSPDPVPPAQVAEEKWSVDDVILQEGASSFEISPDGRWVVWVKHTADKEKDGDVSNLVLSSLTEKKEIELTRGTETHSSPRWSPDGKRIAFISSRPLPKGKEKEEEEEEEEEEDHAQIWLINPFGGEPWPLTRLDRDVAAFEWAGANSIVFAAQESPTRREKKLKEDKDDAIVVDDEPHAPPVRLFQAKLEEEEVQRLTTNEDRIESFALSPDGSRAVAIHGRSLSYVYDERIKPVTMLHDLKSGTHQQLFADGKIRARGFRWSPDGKGFYVVAEHTTHPVYSSATITLVHYCDLEKTVPVNLEWKNGLGDADLAPTPDGFVALLANGARHKAARYTRAGDTWTRAWLEGDHASNLFDVETDGKTIVYNHSTASTPTQWYRATLRGAKMGAPTALTELNDSLNGRALAKSEVIRWKGARDEEVEGILYYPAGHAEGKKYALVVMIHGGPAGTDFDAWDESWAYPAHLMAERGAFVLKPNYHGSSNYGLPWVESIGSGNYYDLEIPDIEKGVDALIAKGLVDADRLGVMGWSNGAILTIGLTVTTTRYKAASAGAGDVDWTSDWGNCEFGAAFDNYYLGASPLDDPDLYRRKSPFYRLKNVKTPTIIFFGTEDTAVPTQQGWMHYRALQQLGQAEVRFLLFPGEPHSLGKLAHQRRKLEEELAWFDRHLFKTAKTENEALNPESPLAFALKLKSAKRVGRSYGVKHGLALIPETVKHGELELGRFEVTRAQYAEFDRAYAIEPGTENRPANGISFEKAKAYCEWLSKLTGEKWRLPDEDEIEFETTEENTLDYWAGYDVNPDDAARLAAKIRELEGTAPLLMEVGRFKPDGEVFDLGGNVAEWSAKGKTLGGSADRPADAKRRDRSPAPEYTGFRIVKGDRK